MRHYLFPALLALPLGLASLAHAAGSNEETAPSKPKCKKGQVYDKKTKSCVSAQESHLDVDDLYQTVRRLAYAGRYDDAQIVLSAMPQDDDRTLTYWGFTHRKMGDQDLARQYYQAALQINPANNLARSYMAQGLVEEGHLKEAIAQLRLIRQHGGGGSWAEASLQQAIAAGKGYSY